MDQKNTQSPKQTGTSKHLKKGVVFSDLQIVILNSQNLTTPLLVSPGLIGDYAWDKAREGIQ